MFAEPSERPLQLILLVVIVGDTKDGGAKISIESNFKQPLASVIEATYNPALKPIIESIKLLFDVPPNIEE